ncbi:ClpP/crotonase [Periconia macrospinosa]|uniref:ClpP/crotonase n=1 Tax=Periconia macrospinosa TaxID=97972 RepID=A0A2V1DMT8_9PLEO|nr:ClpP/crotonase [Periconia macrospinosa]
MAPNNTPEEKYDYEYFNVTFPAEYVAHVEINRPDKLNAFVEVMWLNLSKIFTRLSTSPSVRAIILTGAGDRAFTAGLDVKAASQGLLTQQGGAELDGARKANNLRRHIIEFQDCITAVEKCEKPVVCVYHGVSYGLAVDLGLACDIRVAASDTTFAVKEVDIGIAADVGTLSRLPKLISSNSFVKEICLTARLFSANEALTHGLVSSLKPSKQEAVQEGLKIAKLIAEKSPVAVLGTKHILNYSRDHGVDEGLKYTAVWNSGMLQSRDVGDAVLSGLEKRKPVFSKL